MIKKHYYLLVLLLFLPMQSFAQDYMSATFDFVQSLIGGGNAIGKTLRQVRQESELMLACIKASGDTIVYGASEEDEGFQYVTIYEFKNNVCVERFVMFDDKYGGWIRDAFDVTIDVVNEVANRGAIHNLKALTNRLLFDYSGASFDIMIQNEGAHFTLYAIYTPTK